MQQGSIYAWHLPSRQFTVSVFARTPVKRFVPSRKLTCYVCVYQDTKETACLRLFLDYHGLSLIWSWMVDAAETAIEFKTQVASSSLLNIKESMSTNFVDVDSLCDVFPMLFTSDVWNGYFAVYAVST